MRFTVLSWYSNILKIHKLNLKNTSKPSVRPDIAKTKKQKKWNRTGIWGNLNNGSIKKYKNILIPHSQRRVIDFSFLKSKEKVFGSSDNHPSPPENFEMSNSDHSLMYLIYVMFWDVITHRNIYYYYYYLLGTSYKLFV